MHLVRTTDGWCDVSVDGPGVTRQPAGHVETGRIARSGPALGA
ncbi:hypothetical protein [Amycolatopsis thermophila]|uniref:Uncharacterized protein n=1 Tax=Amycolatopsis thermophila TaxID=206084 RepID=A0ABU0EZ14_9PSEU|nr:hypothetical protein [Amycolatopsis thermophila]MDQ0380547.1 hypothetical protein [Amycolatopsis thermophila]